MKSFFRFFLILLLCSVMLLPAQAAPSDLTLSDGAAATGEVVYLTLTLNKQTQGNTMGVEYSYDTKHLEAVPELCSWSKGGAVKDFGLKGRGVWASQNVTTLEGAICILAFRIKQDADFTQTKVSCSLVVKNETEQTGQYSAEATVKIVCNHSFAAWEAEGNGLHSRKCESCGHSQSEIHKWDAGVIQPNPENSQQKIRLFTCSVCGATRQETVSDPTAESTNPTLPTNPTVPDEPERPAPTEPEETRPQPTEPEDSRPQPTQPEDSRPQPTQPEDSRPQPTEPSAPQPQSPPQPTVPSQQNPDEHDHQDHIITTVPAQQPAQGEQHSPDDGHDHSSGVIYDADGNILATFNPNDLEGADQIHSADDGHDHSGEAVLITNTQPRTETALVVLALAAAGIAAAVFFSKKKKR